MAGTKGLTHRQQRFGKGLARAVDGFVNVKNKGLKK